MNCLREQCNGIITVDGTKKSLPIVEAWCGSSSVYWVNPSFPVNGMLLKIGNPDKSGWFDTIPLYYHPERGMWRAYVPGTYFRCHAETAYKIVAIDEYDRRTVAGEGILRVYGGSIHDIMDDPLESPEIQCYAPFSDGSWRKVTVTEDVFGETVFRIGEKAVDVGQFEQTPKDLYAYNKARGVFFSVSGKIDEVGEPTLYCSDTPSTFGEQSFALDDASKFYYRIEATIDEVGETILKVGDKQT